MHHHLDPFHNQHRPPPATSWWILEDLSCSSSKAACWAGGADEGCSLGDFKKDTQKLHLFMKLKKNVYNVANVANILN